MGHYRVSKKARRRKVADLAAKSKKYSVNNNTIPVVENNTTTVEVDGIEYTVGKVLKWKNKKHPQPKRLRHAYKGYIRVKEDEKYVKKFVHLKSEYPQYKPFKFTREDLKERLIQYKLEKWEKKNPCPAKDDDLFKEEYIPAWKQKKDEALKRIKNFVSSIYDNDIRLHARYEVGDQKYSGYTEIARMKDHGEVTDETDINSLDVKSPLIKKAKKKTNAEKAIHKNLVATNLKDHKRNKGRIILADAA